MKAILLQKTGSFDSLKLVEIETPSPRDTQVLVRMVAISVNYADTLIRKGTYSIMPPLPTIPGLEGSGVVAEVGPQVTHIRPGQPVIVFHPHCYAEYVLADSQTVFPISDLIRLDEAAVLPVVYLTAYHLLFTMGMIKPKQTLLVHAAAGGVGTAVAQLANGKEVTLIGLTSSEEKARYAKSQGFHYLINTKEKNIIQRVHDLTSGQGADLILNSVAGDTLARDIEMLTHFGQVIWYGSTGGAPKGNLTDQLLPHLGKSVGIRFFSLSSIVQSDGRMIRDSLNHLLKELTSQRIKPYIFERLSLSDAAGAHKLLESRAVMGKIILQPSMI